MARKEEFEEMWNVKDMVARLAPSALDGVYSLEDDNIITEPEIYALERRGYRFISVSVNKGKVRALFERI